MVFLLAGQLTETSSRYARKISGTTALLEALKEKQQHIEQLLAERDLERTEVAKATCHAGEVQQELALLRKGQEQVSSVFTFWALWYKQKVCVCVYQYIILLKSKYICCTCFKHAYMCLCYKYVLEMEAKLDQVRRLVETADREKVELLNQLEEEKRSSLNESSKKFNFIQYVFEKQKINADGNVIGLLCRKVEDLQFRVEEAYITKGDLEVNSHLVSSRLTSPHLTFSLLLNTKNKQLL